MQIQVNTNNTIEGTENLAEHVQGMVETALERFADRISRVEVHLGDENAAKSGQNDKRCMIEARLEGRQPTAVTHHAATLDLAASGAIDKLKRTLTSTLERLDARR